MKFFVVFACACLVASAAAGPIGHTTNSKDAQIVKYESDNIGVDGYKFAYETSDGTSRSEHAELKNIGTDHESLAVQGTISWVGDDGQTYTLNYIADENGFQPQGAHLPQ